MNIIDAFAKVIPVIFLIVVGALIKQAQLIGARTIQDIKKLVIQLTLPALLFLAFTKVDIELRYLLIVSLIFTSCILVLLIGRWLQRGSSRSPYFPALLTGFEAGMMGYAIYSSVYGAENIFKFGLIDLGQVVFVFFILIPWLDRYVKGALPWTATVKNFFTSPVILAILAGVAINRIGIITHLSAWPFTHSLLEALAILGGMTTPLVALIIGYQLHLQPGRFFRRCGCLLDLTFW